MSESNTQTLGPGVNFELPAKKSTIVYIASSWKNQHAVEMLTALIRFRGHDVKSFVENAFNEGYYANAQKMNFWDWYNSENGEGAFAYDSGWAANADVVVYLCPSGKDAMCEIGIAYAKERPILGLYAKGEDDGLMHKCITEWFDDFPDLLAAIDYIAANGSEVYKANVVKGIPAKVI
jgi:hypothetical protein